MRQRLLKYLKRLLIVLLVVGAIGVGVFTWFCYWPLEGDVDDLLALVPEEVEFVVRAEYADLRRTGWIQDNVLEDPVHPLLAEHAARALEQAKLQMADLERQINANIPVEALHFQVVRDVLEGEVCVAGNWCSGLGPDRGPPSWQEILIMTRVSWKTRCVAALKHGFIRERLGPNLVVSAEDDEVYKLVFPNVPVLPEAQRAGCGDGFVIPPNNQWYLRRVKDVLAISNSRTLIGHVADLADRPGGARSFARRPGYDVRLQPGRVTAAVNVEPLHSYLMRAFDYYPDLKPIRRFLPPKALEKLNGSISLNGPDLLEGGAEISYIGEIAGTVRRNVYSLADRPVREGIAEMVPAKDTFAVVSLRVEPGYLLKSIAKDIFTPGDRRLVEENIRKNTPYNDLDEFYDDLATRIGTEATIALGRLSSVFDKVDPGGFWSDAPHPRPVGAVLVRIKEGVNQQELEEFLSSRIPAHGFKPEMARVEYRGFTYMRAELEQKILDFKNVTPCFLLANDYLVISSNEVYMRQIIDTINDREKEALAQDDTYRVTMAAVPARGHVGFFIDLEKLSRIPQDAEDDPGTPGTRGWLWDRRNDWVLVNKDIRSRAIAKRKELTAQYMRANGNRPITQQQRDAIEEEVIRDRDQWLDLYPKFEEEYRRELEALRRLRGISLVLGATDTSIRTNFALVFREGEPWLHWRR